MKLPNRWLDYSNSGAVIVGTPFVAFKTPLSKQYDHKIAVEQRFGPSMLPELHPKLSMVVDLTATNRYYHCQDIEQLGMDYVKIHVPGKILPPRQLVDRFFQVADNFRAFNENGSKDKIIGVHCTHGLNRTGYFVCRYLIERMGFSPQDAIEKFELARGHTMERENYVEDLKSCIPFFHQPTALDLDVPRPHHILPKNGFDYANRMHERNRRNRESTSHDTRNERWYQDRFSPTRFVSRSPSAERPHRQRFQHDPRSRNRFHEGHHHQLPPTEPRRTKDRYVAGHRSRSPNNNYAHGYRRSNDRSIFKFDSRPSGPSWQSSRNRGENKDFLRYNWRNREEQ